ncbi:MAG TPA: phospho-N-acetylmuramoyl-pentapeptide-transferase, partial [Acidocella sp.]
MFYFLLLPLAGHIHVFNLFRYISFRAGGACITALIISFWVGPKLIRKLRAMQRHGQPIRTDGPERHLIE